MANQPTARPWFRLASIARTAPPPAPAPAQTPDAQPSAINPQQRPSLMRPAFTTSFRPPTTQPQEPAQPAPPPPPPVSAPPPPPPVSSPSPPPPPVSAPSPPLPAAATTGVTTSVPSSPIIKKTIAPNASSLPPSPSSKGSPSSTRIPVTSSSSVPPSPKPKILAPTASSVPNSPIPKILATNSSQQPKSPASKISSPISSESNSPPPKISAPTSSVPNSPAPKFSAPPLSLKTNSPSPKFTATNSSLQPNFPFPKAAAPTSSSVPNSPTPKAPISAPISAATFANAARLPTPSASLKFTKQPLAQSPPQSPKISSYAPPPSPLVLPPSMLKPEGENGPRFPLEAEQKTVLVQKTIEKPKPTWFNGDSQNNVHKPSNFHNETYEKGSHNKKNSDSEETGMRVITIAGENRGAVMELSHSHRKHGNFLGNPHSLMEKNGSESDSSSDNKGKSKMTDKNHKKMATASPPMNAYTNSNVQGINNSIVFNTSHTHHDPGVHLSLSRKPNGDHKMFQFKDNGHGHGHHS